PGARVAVLLSNCPEYFEIYFACARAGLIAVPLNYRLTPAEMAQVLRHAEPSLLVAGAEYAEACEALAAHVPGLPRWQVDGSGEYESRLAAAHADPFPTRSREDDPAAIFYTSGTTGLPKGAMVSHVNLEMNGYNQAIADGSRPDDINLVSTPIYHVGAVFMAVTYMMLGCTQVILPRFEPGL